MSTKDDVARTRKETQLQQKGRLGALRLKVCKELEGAVTEIGAGRVLCPISEADTSWNAACDRAMRIVRRYVDGKGLFQ